MRDVDLCWRVEAACRHAWPALVEITRGDWSLRFANGRSRRANSANALHATSDLTDEIIAWVEAEYRKRALPPILRVTRLQGDAIDQQLAASGYEAEGKSLTLYADLPAMPMRHDPDVAITSRADEAWFTAMAHLQGWDADIQAGYSAIVRQIDGDAAFFRLDLDGRPAAMAFSVIHDGIACLESVVSDATRRRQGHGSRLVGALLAWAINQGARGACLQVDADNTPALTLYRGMGFLKDLYPYRYRVKLRD